MGQLLANKSSQVNADADNKLTAAQSNFRKQLDQFREQLGKEFVKIQECGTKEAQTLQMQQWKITLQEPNGRERIFYFRFGRPHIEEKTNRLGSVGLQFSESLMPSTNAGFSLKTFLEIIKSPQSKDYSSAISILSIIHNSVTLDQLFKLEATQLPKVKIEQGSFSSYFIDKIILPRVEADSSANVDEFIRKGLLRQPSEKDLLKYGFDQQFISALQGIKSKANVNWRILSEGGTDCVILHFRDVHSQHHEERSKFKQTIKELKEYQHKENLAQAVDKYYDFLADFQEIQYELITSFLDNIKNNKIWMESVTKTNSQVERIGSKELLDAVQRVYDLEKSELELNYEILNKTKAGNLKKFEADIKNYIKIKGMADVNLEYPDLDKIEDLKLKFSLKFISDIKDLEASLRTKPINAISIKERLFLNDQLVICPAEEEAVYKTGTLNARDNEFIKRAIIEELKHPKVGGISVMPILFGTKHDLSTEITNWNKAMPSLKISLVEISPNLFLELSKVEKFILIELEKIKKK